mgnify:CR=1 FL=1
MMEKSLVLIKPDGVQRSLVGEIIKRFENVGLKIIGMKMVYADKAMAGKHYADDDEWMKSVGEKAKKSYEKRGQPTKKTALEIGKTIRNQLMDYITMSPTVALALEGHNAIAMIRKLVGATAPSDSEPGTIRGDFCFDTYQFADETGRPIQNLIHASDAVDVGEREVALWFKNDELHVWKRVDEDLMYRKG